MQAEVLNNLGELGRPGAEDAYRRSIALSRASWTASRPLRTDRHNLAIAQNNLGNFLIEQKRLPEAGPLFAQSVANFEKLVSEAPKAIDLQSHFGIVLARTRNVAGSKRQARRGQDRAGKRRRAPAPGRPAEQERPRLSRAGSAAIWSSWPEINLKLGAYDEAARIALDVPKTVSSSSRAQACFEPRRSWRGWLLRSAATPSSRRPIATG